MGWDKLKLNDLYRSFILESINSTYNVLEGSWRSGKTTALLTAHILYLDDLDVEGLHIIGAESISTAKTILLDNPGGFTYKGFFAERAKEGKYEGKEALTITNSRGKEQILIFVGTSKSNSFQSIRGLTAMSVLITEVNLAHKTFIQEAIGRTISTEPQYRKLFFDLNPMSENHYFYVEFLDEWEKKGNSGDLTLNFVITTYFDNPALTEEQKDAIYKEYDPESVLFKIFILGQRLSQADHIYNLRDENLTEIIPAIVRYIIVVDPGISSSATTFITMGQDSEGTIYIWNYYYHKSGSDLEGPHIKNYRDYSVDLAKYYKETLELMGFAPDKVFLDNDIAFYREATTSFNEANIPKSQLKYAIKEKIEDRIRTTGSLIYQQKIKIKNTLHKVIYAFRNAVYDSKELEEKGLLVREDKPTKNKEIINPVDILDPIEYGVSYLIKRGG